MAEPLIRSFASNAEMVETMAKEEREAAAAMQPWQRDLMPGERIAYAYAYKGGPRAQPGELTIYFEVLVPDHRLKASRMWGRGYSTACPEGEFGTMWRCNALITLTPAAWEAARCQGWPPIDFTQFGYARL
jgi:hypothetical protein